MSITYTPCKTCGTIQRDELWVPECHEAICKARLAIITSCAEEWANRRMQKWCRSNGREHSDVECRECGKSQRIPFTSYAEAGEVVSDEEKKMLTHATDCRAARVLGLPREGE